MAESEGIHIGEIQRRANEEIKVALRQFQGTWFLDIRLHFKDRSTGDYQGTKKGVTIKPNQIAELRELLDVAELEAKAAGLL